MNQSNKEYKSFLTLSGVHTFLNENPNIYFNINEKDQNELKVNPSIDLYNVSSIKELIPIIANHKTNLQKTASNLVVFDGNEESKLMIIGEAPGKDEDLKGEPFVGRAGELLDKILLAIDKKRGRGVYIANVLKCRPPDNRDPLPSEVNKCEPYLIKQIKIVKPKLIVALGRIAGKTLLKIDKPLKEMRGIIHSYNGIPLIVTYHPAALLRNPKFKKPTWDDFQWIRDQLIKYQ